MINVEKGRYWDFGFQLIDGCTPCSPGCDNCWSASMTHRFNFQWTDKGRFNGKITVHPEKLNIPLKRKKPAVYAIWNDLFHEDVTQEFQEDVFDIMSECVDDRHTFLILTKRPKRLAEFLDWDPWTESVWPNIYLGLTVCNQQEIDEKSEVFFGIPGKKFLSLEPLLLKVIIPPWVIERRLLSAVILGGETGPKARPMNPDWVRSVRDQCQAAGVPFFFKGWGEWADGQQVGFFDKEYQAPSRVINIHIDGSEAYIGDGKGLPQPNWRFGKKVAGRMLDGRTHDDLPWVKSA